MNTMIIAIAVVIVVAAIGGYMLLYSAPSAPSYTAPTTVPQPTTVGLETTIDDTGATAVATQAETVASDTAGEIGAADNMEVPDVQ